MEDIPLNNLAHLIERSVEEHGVSPRSVWLDQKNAIQKGVLRANAMCRMLQEAESFSVLDLGCGPGLLVPYLEERFGSGVADYLGIDISGDLIRHATGLFPARAFMVRDILREPLPEQAWDYTIINGVLTAKYEWAFERMESFASEFLRSAWAATKRGLSFNVMSPYVDWTRSDLFHWPVERAMAFCVENLSRHVNVLADYGLYEYTVQVFREPRQPVERPPRCWMALEAGGDAR
jgi:SAM-dependent methyltransferase